MRPTAVAPTGRRILVVDDNRDAADMMAEYLAALGHEVEVAYDGPEALTIAPRFAPHVALLDIGLPVMDGYELGRRLRAQADSREIELIAVTGYGQEHDRRESRAAGFDLHLVKPVDLDQLAKAVSATVPRAASGSSR